MQFIKLTVLLKDNEELPTYLNIDEILTLTKNFKAEFIAENYVINYIPGTIIHFKSVDRSITVLESIEYILTKINAKE